MKKVISRIYDIPSDYYVIALIAIIAYFIGYLLFPATPGHTEKYFMGWFGWCDQGCYLKSAKAMAHWKLSPETYIYPLGYPLLAVPFVKRFSLHPFLIPNLFFSVGIVLAFYASCRKFVTSIESAALTIFLIILSGFTSTKVMDGGLIWFRSLIIPWNSIPVFFAAYLAIWSLVFNKATFPKLWIVSVAIALAFFCRPPDVLFLGIIYLAGLVDLKTFKEKIQGLLVLIFPCLVVLAAILISKWVIFHSLFNPYDINNISVGFNSYDLPFKFYLIFFDGSPICGFKECMLLPQMPWLLLCVPGVMLLVKHTNTKFWYLIGAIALCLTIYISYNAEAPSSMFNYHGFHYFMWVFPWLGLCSYLTLTRSFAGIGKWQTVVGVLAVVLLVLVIGWEETVVATVSPNQLIERYDSNSREFSSGISLPAPVLSNGIRIIFAKMPSRNMGVAGEWEKFHLIVDGRKQILYSDYNLYQSDNAVYVSFRNSINQTGKIQRMLFQYDDTDLPVLDKVLILKKEFKLFGFIQKVFI